MVGRGQRKFGIWNRWFSILYCCFNIKITTKTKFNKYRLSTCIFFTKLDQIWKQLFLTLISKIKYQSKFEDVHEKPELRFLPAKCHLWLSQSEFITLRWSQSRALNFLLLKLDLNVVFKYILVFEAASWEVSKSDFKKIAVLEQIFKIFPIIKSHGSEDQMSFPHVAYDICTCPKYKSAS